MATTPTGVTTEQLRAFQEDGYLVVKGLLAPDETRRLIDAFYLCRALNQQFHPSPEIAEFGYFPIDALPEGVSPLLREMVERFVADGHLPPEMLEPHVTDDGV